MQGITDRPLGLGAELKLAPHELVELLGRNTICAREALTREALTLGELALELERNLLPTFELRDHAHERVAVRLDVGHGAPRCVSRARGARGSGPSGSPPRPSRSHTAAELAPCDCHDRAPPSSPASASRRGILELAGVLLVELDLAAWHRTSSSAIAAAAVLRRRRHRPGRGPRARPTSSSPTSSPPPSRATA